MTLTPPESLTPPEAVSAVPAQQAPEMVPLTDTDRRKLDDMSRAFLQDLLAAGVHTDEFRRKVDSVHELGLSEQRTAASNRMLERPLRAQVNLENSDIMRGLTDLRRTVEELDPSRAVTSRKLFGMLPIGRKVQNTLDQYQSAQTHINATIAALYRGQDELRKDNASIEQEKVALWQSMQKLRQYAYIAQQLDESLSAELTRLAQTDAEKARIVSEELLFALRQRTSDLLTQLAVSIQGYLALDLIRRNNLELIKGVDRATTTTVSALRTGMMVSSALGTQGAVLGQVNAMNKTTESVLSSTATLLRQQSAQIQQQASSATLDPAVLSKAFTEIYGALDSVSTYRAQALDRFRQTIAVLEREVSQANTYLDQDRQDITQSFVNNLQLKDDQKPNPLAAAHNDLKL